MKSITFLGEAMIEVAANGRKHFGGDTLNSAVYLARVSASEELSIRYASAVGCDKDSELLLAFMQQENIETSLVTRNKHKTLGHYQIQVDACGERSFNYKEMTAPHAITFLIINAHCLKPLPTTK